MFGRRRAPAPAAPTIAVISEIVGDDFEEQRARAVMLLRRIVDEAVIRQDEAEALLLEIRGRGPLAQLSKRGGYLMRRFGALRLALPAHAPDPLLRMHVEALREVLDHHTMMVDTALNALSVDWRSERIGRMLDGLDGLGAPAKRLEALRHELHHLPGR